MDDSLGLSSLGVYSKYSNSYTDTTSSTDDNSNSYMDFDGYLKLMVAQMQNQDFNDPMSDSEVLNQMAQYSMLEGIKNMTQQSNISYATSLVGRVVTINNGSAYHTGKVESVSVSNGVASLMIDGRAFESSAVSDIVDPDIYAELSGMIGKTVKVNTTGGEAPFTGKVTDVVYFGGESYVAVGDKIVLADMVEIVEESGENAEENNGSTETGTEENNTEENLVTESSEVQTYSAKSQALVDILMKELDEAEKASQADKSSTEKTDSVSGVSGVSTITDDYVMEIAMLEVPDYGAGIYADTGVVTASLSNVDNTYGSVSGTVSLDEYNSSRADLDSETAERTADGKLKGVTVPPSSSSSDCVPHRISVEAYPEEAALADELGTRMYDIRFIHNTAITSRIKTDEVIGHTQSGKAITEIGYSGVGQLGEVVTFADGTQRVEVLLKSGKSTWLMTSGNLTLDEICTRTGAPGSLAGKLTPEESAIRHYSNPTEIYGTAGLNAFKSQIIAQGSV
ncbi:MAG: flagellar hook assembly protein FlgD [Oscillospiraceae bacterium]